MSSGLSLGLNLRLWFGVLGAPFAWTAQHIAGFALTQVACNAAREAIAFEGLTFGLTVAAALTVVASGLCSLTVFRQTREAGDGSEGVPLARVHFLATVGLAIAPLFLAIVVMSGTGAFVLGSCRQS